MNCFVQLWTAKNLNEERMEAIGHDRYWFTFWTEQRLNNMIRLGEDTLILKEENGTLEA